MLDSMTAASQAYLTYQVDHPMILCLQPVKCNLYRCFSVCDAAQHSVDAAQALSQSNNLLCQYALILMIVHGATISAMCCQKR